MPSMWKFIYGTSVITPPLAEDNPCPMNEKVKKEKKFETTKLIINKYSPSTRHYPLRFYPYFIIQLDFSTSKGSTIVLEIKP